MLQNSSLPWSDQNNWVYLCMCVGMYRLNPLKSCVRAIWIMNCLEYPSILLQMDYIYHMHHMKCSAFSDSVWRQTDVGRTVLHTNDVRIMPWSVFLASKSQTLYKLKCLVMKRDSLSSQSPTAMAAGKCNDISMATWLFYPSPEADNHTRKPKLCPLMYLGMKPTEHRSTNLEKSR